MNKSIEAATRQLTLEMLYEIATGIPRCFTELKEYKEVEDGGIVATTSHSNLPKYMSFVGSPLKSDWNWVDSFTEKELHDSIEWREKRQKESRERDKNYVYTWPFEYLEEEIPTKVACEC